LYLTVNYHSQQFQLAPVLPESDLSSDLRAIGSSSSVNCPASHSVSGGDISVIVVGSILAIILILVLLLWIYKGRPLLSEWRAERSKQTPRSTMEDGVIVQSLSNLKEDVNDLRGRVEAVEHGGMAIAELVGSHNSAAPTSPTSPQRPSIVSIEEMPDSPRSPPSPQISRRRLGSY
jgi:hypothetical protein